MKTLRPIIFTFAGIAIARVATAAEPPKGPIVTLEPFEPGFELCFNWKDKFVHPEEIIAPKFEYPLEMKRAGIDGDIGILVQIDGQGYVKRLSVLYSNRDQFLKCTIAAFEKARWKSPGRLGVWFYYNVVYRIAENPNEKLGPTATLVMPPAE